MQTRINFVIGPGPLTINGLTTRTHHGKTRFGVRFDEMPNSSHLTMWGDPGRLLVCLNQAMDAVEQYMASRPGSHPCEK